MQSSRRHPQIPPQTRARSKKRALNLLFLLLALPGFLLTAPGWSRDWQSVESRDDFRFLVIADPQIGPANTDFPLLRQANRRLNQLMAMAQNMSPKPDFLVFNGDLGYVPSAGAFENFEAAMNGWDAPLILVRGLSDGGPMNRLINQARGNLGLATDDRQVLRIGRWRLITLPPVQMLPSPQDRQTFVEWLEQELNKTNAPTMVFHHIPILPTGISALIEDSLPMNYGKMLADTLVENGNVRYVFTGQTQTGVRASVRSSRNYRGVSFVSTPSLFEVRGIDQEHQQLTSVGREDYGGYFLEVQVKDDAAAVHGRKTGIQSWAPFGKLALFPDRDASAYFSPRGDLPASSRLTNGGFENGMDDWNIVYRYRNESLDNSIARVQSRRLHSGSSALELAVNPRGTAWIGDESIEAYQVVDITAMTDPTFSARYMVPRAGRSYFGGGYIRLHAYANGERAFAVVLHWGARESRVRYLPKQFTHADGDEKLSLGAFGALARAAEFIFYELPDNQGSWESVEVNLAQILEMYQPDQAYSELNIDKAMIAFGVWAGPDFRTASGAFLDDVKLQDKPDEVSRIGGRTLKHSDRHLLSPYGSWDNK